MASGEKTKKNAVTTIVDTSKPSKMAKELEIEMSTYKYWLVSKPKLFPLFRGLGFRVLISTWILILFLSQFGEIIVDEQFVEHYNEI